MVKMPYDCDPLRLVQSDEPSIDYEDEPFGMMLLQSKKLAAPPPGLCLGKGVQPPFMRASISVSRKPL